MTHPAVEVVARAICCPDGNCKALSTRQEFPKHLYHMPCNSNMHQQAATAAIRALLDVPVNDAMVEAGVWATADIMPQYRKIFTAMLTQLVREIENDSIQT